MPDDSQPALDIPLSVRTRLLAGALIAAVAGASLAFFYSRGLVNLYGDSMAHLEGARRFLDSLTPGYAEIGTVWLPIPHLLMSVPAQNDFLWRTGLAGGIVSTVAFALAAWIVFRLSHAMNGSIESGVVALAGFMLCPNMMYLASTPLTEPLALLFILLMVQELFRFRATGETVALVAAALAGFAGTLTRYEAWSLLPFAAFYVAWSRGGTRSGRIRSAALFSIIAGAGPLLWLLHNAYRFNNPFEFYDGAFSAKAIYAHQLATTAFRFPTEGSWLVAARYYLEDLKLVIGVWPLVLSLLGLVAWAADSSRRANRVVALLLLLPFPFHLQSMAHAAIPLYVPTLFPNTYWNLRLGIEMLPAAALLPSFLVPAIGSRRLRGALVALLLGCIVGQHIWTARHGAAELAIAKEGVLNSPCRNLRQQKLTQFLRASYNGGKIFLAAGKWPCALPELGIPFRNTVSDANPEAWNKMAGAADRSVGWIVRGEDEPVDWLMRAHPQAFRDFEIVFHENIPGEGSLTVYRRRAG